MRWVVLIAAATVLADQLTKELVVRFLRLDDSLVVITGFLNLVNVHNTGAAWGILRDRNTVLAVVCLLTILVLYLFRHSFQLEHKVARVALGLIAGGIVGNLIDRIRWGWVIDFVDFYVDAHHWPAFNVADSAICVGVCLYIFVSWRNEPKKPGL